MLTSLTERISGKLPIGYLSSPLNVLSAPPSCGLGSAEISAKSELMMILFVPSGSPSLVNLIEIPVPSTNFLNASPDSVSLIVTSGVLFVPSVEFCPVYVLGTSPKPMKDNLSPRPKELYSSRKLSFTLRKESRILSPVPSLPITPMSIILRAMFYPKIKSYSNIYP